MERVGSERRPGLQVGRALALLSGLVAGIGLGVFGVRQVSRAARAVLPGQRAASAQETVAVGDRAVLVLEPGASVRWRELADALVIEQNAGEVFYRVEGPRVDVRTPFAVVRAAGTCFQVVVHKESAEAELLVTTFEGRVQLARGSSEVDLGPGERGLIARGGAPMRLRRGEKLPGSPPPPEPTAAEQP